VGLNVPKELCGRWVHRCYGIQFLASLLHRRRSMGVNHTLHDVWPSPELVHYIYTFGGSCPLTEFCHVQNSLCVQVLRYHILAVAALLHGTRAVGVSQTLRRGIFTRQGDHPVRHWAVELSSCLSVCLLATLRKNFLTDLHEIFWEGCQLHSKRICYVMLRDRYILSLLHQLQI